MLRSLLSLVCLCATTFAAEAEKPFGLTDRVPWASSRLLGTPDPALPYVTERVYPHIKMDGPLDLCISPNGQRWFVCEDKGVIYTFPHNNEAERADIFLDLRRKDHRYLQWFQQRRMWSIAFHPKYSDNGYVYVCYHDSLPGPSRTRLSRFTVDLKNPADPPTCDPDSEFIVAEWQAGVDHFGGCLKFGKDGMLYVSVGDGSAYADGTDTGQDLSDFHCSVLRIDVDQNDKGKSYAIPKDNPFVDLKGARGEVWAYGLRNIWKMSIDRETGDLWGGDVGQDLWDWIVRIEKGGNYGWSVTEGSHPFRPHRKVGPTPIQKPIVEHEHSEARSITGGCVYRGKRLPELVGSYIYGDFETGKIWSVRYDTSARKLIEHRELADTTIKIVGFGEDLDGELFILDYQGTVHQFAPAPPQSVRPEDFPRLLSQTGLFASTAKNEVAPGVIPYSVNSPLWSDGAAKERFMAIPAGKQIEYTNTGAWKFPEGSVLVKTFAMDMEAGKPTSRRRLETRLMHLYENHWRGYTYVWNADQTDAELLSSAGLNERLSIDDPDAPGGKREQTWRYPSRAECSLCHTASSGFVLGLNTLQMNRSQDYGDTTDNQLRALDHIGMFKKPVKEVELAVLPPEKRDPAKFTFEKLTKLSNPHDEKEPLDARARSYLHANCAHCHMQWGGGNALFELQYWLPLGATKTVDTAPMHGDFGVKDAKVLVQGHPERSLIPIRMNRLGHGRMPHIASTVIDEPAVELIQKWIDSLGK